MLVKCQMVVILEFFGKFYGSMYPFIISIFIYIFVKLINKKQSFVYIFFHWPNQKTFIANYIITNIYMIRFAFYEKQTCARNKQMFCLSFFLFFYFFSSNFFFFFFFRHLRSPYCHLFLY